MHHQPFGWIERHRIGFCDATHPTTEFGTDESAASVGGIDVQPQFVLFANVTNLG
jgi:hypothetical protein